ncbi:MAG: LLM class flavin-dependent oxidoreductase [Proteobacteria bacterium]|nr:LLM class flavin-dependent oxidoreductase [Pseudomonadota bacterium]
MEFGIQFFPDVGPDKKSGEQYWTEALHLCGLCDGLGFTHIRTVEHYFHPYGGYSPNPIVFLSAAAMASKMARLVTGAVLPVFNNPLKLAGEAGMIDAISHGRLELGFARAFLPHEFARFGVDVNESRERFDEGVAQVIRLLAEENVTMNGKFHSFKNVTSLPRPTQRPHPPIWIAALGTPESFERAGKAGYHIMAIPLAGGKMAELLGLYRESWRAAGHKGNGKVMLAFHMLCAETRDKAVVTARRPLNDYLTSLVDAASDWMGGMSSKDYPGYDKIIAKLKAETFESQVESGAAWVGTPTDIRGIINEYDKKVGGFETASLQVNFHDIAVADAEASMRLFARDVMPHFTTAARAA